MNIPMSWLNGYVPLEGVDIREFTDKLTMIGQKVEGVEFVAEELEKIVAGRILKLRKHESADKLLIAEVDCGNGTLNIVTGAENVFEGALVPVALPGATLSGGVKIERTELKGVVSEGMMCSVEELGFTRHDFPEAPEHGIYIFEEDVPVGADVCELLELKQAVVEYEITSNRPDCHSVIGIAREAAAAYEKPFNMPDMSVKEEAGGNASDMISIEIIEKELCPRYAARVIENVTVEASPMWLRRRLTSAGLRPINNIVDITNYVMLEMGQPMHAFDLNEVSGGIVVKRAKDGEKFVTLDGTERTLDSSVLVIADHEKSLAVAGVMGGENSKITLSQDGKKATGAVLLESANFNGTSIRLTSKKLGLRTDASGKFEKGLDPNLAEAAVNRAAHLIEQLGAGSVVRGVADCFPDRDKYVEKAILPFEPDKINRLLGTDIMADDMKKLLLPFGIEIEGDNAVIPTFRGDIEGTADLAEEVARAFGYDKIVPEMLRGAPTVGKKTYEQIVLDIIRDAMVSFGYYEAITFSFEGPQTFGRLLIGEDSPLRRAVTIMNPLGESYSVMRTTAANGILESLSTNYSKRNQSARLFEIANVYLPEVLPLTEPPAQKSVLIAGVYGDADFYAAKGCAETLLDALGIKEYEFKPASDISWLHPGRGAKIFVCGEEIGYVGEVHPDCLENYAIGKRAYVFELAIDCLYKNAVIIRRFGETPKYPPVQRDIAVTVSDGVMAGDIRRAIVEAGSALLAEIELFDVYKGGQVGEGMKSLAYSLTFRSREKTLSDNEVNPLISDILNELEKRFDAKLRE